MSNPASSPGQYPERLRDSVASVSKASKSMKQWLTSKGETPKSRPLMLLAPTPPGPSETAPQLLPPAVLKSRLGPCSVSNNVDTAYSSSTKLVQLKESIDLELPAPVQPEETESDKLSLRPISEETHNVDTKAPLPAPLHVIEAFTCRDAAHGLKPKLSSPNWSVSELAMPESESLELPFNSDGADSAGLWGPLPPPGNDRVLSVVKGPDPATEGWAITCVNPPTVQFLSDGTRDPFSDQRDIDPQNGLLLSPVEYPETHKSQNPGQCHDMRDLNWRQANMTSELWIAREIKNRRHIAQKIRAEIEEKNKVVQPAPVEDSWPTANCLLRPATPNDFSGIAAIMNEERRQENALQILESVIVGPQDVRKIYETCRRDMRPFIVAVSSGSTLLDRSKWPEGADKEFEEFVRFKKSQKSSKGEIIGFAFVADSRLDLFGFPCRGSRFTGRIILLVASAQRRKLYGSALLDRILLSVAVYHRSLVDYKWECKDPALVYEHLATRNRRMYSRLYIEALFETGKTNQGIAKMLEKFDFRQVARFEEAIRAGRSAQSPWLDLIMWELEARPVEEIGDDAP
ncbi:hypothetical protein G7Z17_g3489 [Cylindrodendrum hubeiense]|uniref:Uncharacterized protein n=1 Tax=Cylindrodendrum hubeiense TaxID=595255 RepID=A0A9P5HCE8_9HYPO|nr:hypothetical protein G7Z17_g3489 [Cylindrodendrum hubeiense]